MTASLSLAMISDTHGNYDPARCGEVDLFLHAGDLCRERGNEAEFCTAVNWIKQVKARHRIVVAGNHDTFLYEHPRQAEARLGAAGITYLRDALIEIDGIRIYGTPWTEELFGYSFELPEDELIRKWQQIPTDVDILITHIPPLSVLDRVKAGNHQGSASLARRLVDVKPLLHLFGHIHESYGCLQRENGWSVNAAIGMFPDERRLPFFARVVANNNKNRSIEPWTYKAFAEPEKQPVG